MAPRDKKRKSETPAAEEQGKKQHKVSKKQQVEEQEEEEEEQPVDVDDEDSCDGMEVSEAQKKHFQLLKEVVERVGGVQYTMESFVGDMDSGDDADDIVVEDLPGSDEDEDDEDEDEDEEAEQGDGDDDEAGSEEEEDGGEGQGEEVEIIDEDDLSSASPLLFSEEEISNLRHIIVTKRRDEYLEKMSELLLGEQASDDVLKFDANFSKVVFQCVPKELKTISKMATVAEQFDALFALTKTLQTYELWLQDVEDQKGLTKMLKDLGSNWKRLLAMSNEELDIDPEFTRLGTEKMLENFEVMINNSADAEVAFVWK